jgi:hypothetical protein
MTRTLRREVQLNGNLCACRMNKDRVWDSSSSGAARAIVHFAAPVSTYLALGSNRGAGWTVDEKCLDKVDNG